MSIHDTSLDEAQRHADRGDWALVARIANQVISRTPESARAWHLRGVAAYQTADYEAAFADLEQAHALAPQDVEILDHLGASAAKSGRLDRAAECFAACLELDPARADAAYNLGNIMRRQRNDVKAEQLFRQACQLRPTFWQAVVNWANTLRDLRRWCEADQAFQDALSLRPDHARTWNQLGVLYLRQRDWSAARRAFEESLRLRPRHPETSFNLGNTYRELGETGLAAECYRQAVAGEPNLTQRAAASVDASTPHPVAQLESVIYQTVDEKSLHLHVAKAQFHLANRLRDQGSVHEAVSCYHEALRNAPDRVAGWNNLGNCLLSLRRFEEAESCFRKAFALCDVKNKAGRAQAQNNLAAAWMSAGRLSEAMELFAQVVRDAPDYAAAQSNLGAALQDLGDFDQSAQALRRAIDLAPDMADAHWNRALLNLRRGELLYGWPEYEWRWQRVDFCQSQFRVPSESSLSPSSMSAHPVARRTSMAPPWRGGPTEGKTVLVFCEQGLGDTIQFLRFAADLKRRGACVLLEVQQSLMSLVRPCPFVDILVPQGAAIAEHAYQVALMSLPASLGVSRSEDLTRDAPYLYADNALRRAWREKLQERRGVRVGIHWQGNPNYPMDRFRSIPLAKFAPLSAVAGIRLISLQHGFGSEQIAACSSNVMVESLPSDIDQQAGPFMDTAAILSELDLVVTSDSAIAHLAGALGVKTWLALPYVADWRWMEGERSDRGDLTPWYPSMRLFRQRRAGDWDELFARIAAAMRDEFQLR